jgi:hypothetical protein
MLIMMLLLLLLMMMICSIIAELESSDGDLNDDGPGGGDEFMAVKPWYKHCLLEFHSCHYAVFYASFVMYLYPLIIFFLHNLFIYSSIYLLISINLFIYLSHLSGWVLSLLPQLGDLQLITARKINILRL